RGNNRMQYLFLNGRHIRDRSLGHALGEAYRGLLLTGRYPVAFLRVEMPSELVDVNVHPTKIEVRFQDSGTLYSGMLSMLRTRFLSTDLTARVRLESDPSSATDSESRPDPVDEQPFPPKGTRRDEINRWFDSQKTPQGGSSESPLQQEVAQQAELNLEYPPRPTGGAGWPISRPGDSGVSQSALPHRGVPEFKRFDSGDQRSSSQPLAGGASPGGGQTPVNPMSPSAVPTANASVAATSTGTQALQLHNRYLVTETNDGMIVIDQHALHERILYEQLREKVLSGVVEKQRLLVPETVHLAPREAAAVLEIQETLAQLGIDVEPFGGDTVLVSSYPAMLANLSPVDLIRQVAEDAVSKDRAPQRRELLDELLHMISCKAAIKAGDRLTSEEISALVEQRTYFQDSHHCPHGRPTSLLFTREELDRRFQRT
ncbi:MAG: DNA mismatch repair protein MutL, partial [Planctomycetales bacterium]|nr:DNA mismatch repair protein MutL [Planctomycetales bacterium]